MVLGRLCARASRRSSTRPPQKHQGRRVRFAGREATPSVATGFMTEHRAQEVELLKEAFQHTEE